MGSLFGGKPNSAQTEVYTGIQVSTSMYGSVIPYVAGRQRIPYNLLWYGNFNVQPGGNGGGKGGGGGNSSSYNYYASYIAALCLGPIKGVFQVWHDKTLETLLSENLTLSLGGSAPAAFPWLTTYTPIGSTFTGYISGLTLQVVSQSLGTIAQGTTVSGPGVAAGTVITGVGASGGGLGGYTVNLAQTVGSVGSPVAMTTSGGATGSQAIPYDHIACVGSGAYYLGTSANMPNLTFEVEGSVPGYADAHGVYDADPSAVLIDYLTDPVHGALAGPGGAAIVIGSATAPLQGAVNSYQAYCLAMGLLTSPYEDTQRGAMDFVQELLQITNSDVVLSFGTMKVIPYADQPVAGTTADGASWSYTPNLTPIFSFNDGDYCPKEGDPPVVLKRKPLADTHNIVNVEYNDRLNYYNACPASASDLADIAKYGPRVMSTLTLHQITSAGVAKLAAQLILQADLYERNTFVFKVRADYAVLEPMDYVALTDANLGLTNQVVRIQEIEDDGSNELQITAMLVPGVVRSTPLYNWQQAQGIYLNYNAQPGSVLAPAIFQMPPLPLTEVGGIPLGIAVCGPSTSGTWGGAYVYCSADGGNTYSMIGQITSAAEYGTLSTALAAVPDPDTTSILQVALANSNGQIPLGVTHADADNFLTLLLVGSGLTAEVLSYGQITLLSPGNYTMQYLRRGLYGTVPEAPLSGAKFVKLDGNIFTFNVDPGFSGQTLFFKFQSVNTFGQGIQPLAQCVAYAYTCPSTPDIYSVLIPRGSCSIDDENVYKSVNALAAWDSDCVSTQAFVGGAQALARYGSGNNWAVGLVTSTLVTLAPGANMDYCIRPNVTGHNYLIYEGATLALTIPQTPVHNDILQVVYDGFFVRYFINGLQVRAAGALGKTFFLGLAMFDPGDVAGSVEFTTLAAATPSQFVATGTCTVNNTNAGKPNGAALWDSGIYSITGYGTCHVSAKVNNPATDIVMIGLSQNPGKDPSYTNMDFGLYCAAGSSQWTVYESGVGIAALTQPQPSDVATITYDGTEVRYYINGQSVHVTAAFGLTLYGFCPFYSVGAGLNSLRFGPTTNLAVSDTSQLGANAASQMVSLYDSAGFSVGGVYTGTTTGVAENLTIVTTGFPVAVDFTSGALLLSVGTGATSWSFQFEIFRDGVSTGACPILQWSSANATGWTAGTIVVAQPISFTFVDPTVPAGSHVYNLHYTITSAGNVNPHATTFLALQNDMKLREIKK